MGCSQKKKKEKKKERERKKVKKGRSTLVDFPSGYILGSHSKETCKFRSSSFSSSILFILFAFFFFWLLLNFCCRLKSTLPGGQIGLLIQHAEDNFLPAWPKHHLWKIKPDSCVQSSRSQRWTSYRACEGEEEPQKPVSP